MAEPPATIPPSPGRDEEEDEVEASRAPLLDHLNELRSRIIKVIIAIVIGFAITFVFREHVYSFLSGPFWEAMARARGELAADNRFIITQPLEQFFVYLKLGLFGGIILSFPYIAYQAYAFIAPGLYRNERATVLPYLIAAPVLFLMGCALVYFFVLPFVMRFAFSTEIHAKPLDLSTVQSVVDLCPQIAAMTAEQARVAVSFLGTVCPSMPADDLARLTADVNGALADYARQPRTELLPKVSDYLSLVTMLMLVFGFSFQMPIALSLAGRAGLVTAQQLRGGRKYAIVAIFAFAAFATPPDPLSQIALGLAIMALYELSIVSVWLSEKKRAEDEEEAEADA
jgi:sec-independent protein translocase protein TatC